MNRLFIRAVSAALSVLTLICTAGCGRTENPRAGEEPVTSGAPAASDGTVRYYVKGPVEPVLSGIADQAPGYISGKRVQTPDENGEYAPVTAVPMTGYRFAGWSDGVKDAVRTETPGNAPESVTALFARPSFFARKTHSSLFALPSTGGAASAIFSDVP